MTINLGAEYNSSVQKIFHYMGIKNRQKPSDMESEAPVLKTILTIDNHKIPLKHDILIIFSSNNKNIRPSADCI